MLRVECGKIATRGHFLRCNYYNTHYLAVVLRQPVAQFVYRLQHMGLVLQLRPRDRRLGSGVPQNHSPIHFYALRDDRD
jgi:hypothetical protein